MATHGVTALPADLFHLISQELSARGDYPSLFNCIASSKHFASSGAITALYRISHDSPVKGGGSEDLPLAEQDLTVQRWSILWRTIILSALGQTSYPYCKHLRMLDLRDLADLLDDEKFKQGKIARHFFSGPLSRFNFLIELPARASGRNKQRRLDVRRIVTSIGHTITEHAPLLEALTEPTIGDILSTVLLSWTPRLTHLRRLDLWDGKTLGDETVRNLLHAHCPSLNSLCIFQWLEDHSDNHLASFLNGMQENTLTYFENLSVCNICTETCLALTYHGKSLSVLKLALMEEGILALDLLHGCTALETLEIATVGPPQRLDLKGTQNEHFVGIQEWLKRCSTLREISLKDMISAPDLLTPVLLNKDISLSRLQVNASEQTMYIAKDHHDFHRALGQKQSLRELSLRADPEAIGRDDIDILMSSLCSLKQLRKLNLTRISDYFSDEHIMRLAQSLPHLEDLYIGGFGITDKVFDSLAGLVNLKSLSFSGITSFTVDGMLDFVNQLGDGNRGLVLAVDNADTDSGITQEGQELVAEALITAVEGRFQYQLLRDPNMPEFYSDDSD